tara:strand:- start:21499 stop:21981 length:483 start_codon:yes stop_codon:yes gene_type:complete
MTGTFSEQGKVVTLIPIRSLGTGNTAVTADVDCRGYDWMYVVFEVDAASGSTGTSTVTLEAAQTIGGTYSVIEDDSANMVAGGSGVTAGFSQAQSFTGTRYGEIDLRQHPGVIRTTVDNDTNGTLLICAHAVLSKARRGTIVDQDLSFQITSKAKSGYPY